MTVMTQNSMKVYIQPLKVLDSFDEEIDVTDYVLSDSLGEVREFIDSEDYDFGIFAFGEITFEGDNSRGMFNDFQDPRSIFPYGRFKGKVRLAFEERTITRDAAGTITDSSVVETTLFNGILSEDSIRTNFESETVSITALSLDSVLSTAKILPGEIATGSTIEAIIIRALSKDSVTAVLTVVPGNISVGNDFVVDDVTFFDNLSVRETVKTALLSSNSVLTIDPSGTVFVSNRDENLALPVINLFGRYSILGEENVVDIFELNSGFHRIANSMIVNGSENNDLGSIDEYGLRQKSIDLNYITTPATADAISSALLGEFLVPKIEGEVTVPLAVGKSARILQRVTIDSPLKRVPPDGVFLAIIGEDEWSSSETGYPVNAGSFEITNTTTFKIIERKYDLKNFVSTLKFRQTGTDYGEGYSA